MSLRSLRSIVAGQPPAVAEKTLTVLEAAILMKEKGKGALLVVEASRSERHLHRAATRSFA
jgi:CBS domain-containing protein